MPRPLFGRLAGCMADKVEGGYRGDRATFNLRSLTILNAEDVRNYTEFAISISSVPDRWHLFSLSCVRDDQREQQQQPGLNEAPKTPPRRKWDYTTIRTEFIYYLLILTRL